MWRGGMLQWYGQVFSLFHCSGFRRFFLQISFVRHGTMSFRELKENFSFLIKNELFKSSNVYYLPFPVRRVWNRTNVFLCQSAFQSTKKQFIFFFDVVVVYSYFLSLVLVFYTEKKGHEMAYKCANRVYVYIIKSSRIILNTEKFMFW